MVWSNVSEAYLAVSGSTSISNIMFELKSFETDKDEANWVIDKIEELLSKKNEFEEIEGAITLDKIGQAIFSFLV